MFWGKSYWRTEPLQISSKRPAVALALPQHPPPVKPRFPWPINAQIQLMPPGQNQSHNSTFWRSSLWSPCLSFRLSPTAHTGDFSIVFGFLGMHNKSIFGHKLLNLTQEQKFIYIFFLFIQYIVINHTLWNRCYSRHWESNGKSFLKRHKSLPSYKMYSSTNTKTWIQNYMTC